ncbi:HDA1 complex subunit 3 [[Candida] jaroonii]|uniref:HDA1 complex subunit 3 n=1 Tax=[Candida] jaroonii TaxID=467808 RepID=A0ACA9Y5H1_9ASCO|nr:HDA1 complex subunit 3 [[Candida] jaroonii]
MDLLRILDSTPEPPIVDLHIDKINDSGEYELTCPIYEFQKELTDQIVSLHYSDILKYCETNDKTELIVKSSQICIENCMLVSSHPYLLITHYMPKNLLQRDMALKLAETSGKFNVLKDLVNVMTEVNKNIILSNGPFNNQHNNSRTLKAFPPSFERKIAVVMTNNVKLFDLVEALLIGTSANSVKIKKYVGNYLRRDHKKHEPTHTNISIHLIPDDGITNSKEDISSLKFDLIIKFDEQVNNDFIEKIRLQNRESKACLIKLIPLFTIEHCKLFYEGRENDADYLYNLISSVVCLRDQIGILPPDIFPIYNQGLNYLSTFFDQLFKNSTLLRFNYPIWPLPGLPSIPKFSAIDVEKSLLTEVNYHYTPYDNESSHKDTDTSTTQTYYEVNRLQSNYITNSLTNNFDKLIGILNHNSKNSLTNYLTHKLVLELNSCYIDYGLVKKELSGYEVFNDDHISNKIGRRELELNKSLSSIIDDVNHASQRIELGNKKVDKRLEEIENLKKDIQQITERLKDVEYILKTFSTESDQQQKKQAIENQIKIWDSQDKVKQYISDITKKQDEKTYLKNEMTKTKTLIEENTKIIEEAKTKNHQFNKRLENFKENDLLEIKNIIKERHEIQTRLNKAKDMNIQLKSKLNKSFKFLKESSHLKKRKGRGITPK